jgi:hypothetical protein
MKAHIQQLLEQAIVSLQTQNILPEDIQPRIVIDRTKDKSHGDFANNLAMMLAKPAKQNPRALAQLICENIPASDLIVKTEIAGPGFINFFINPNFLEKQIDNAFANPRLDVESVKKTTNNCYRLLFTKPCQRDARWSFAFIYYRRCRRSYIRISRSSYYSPESRWRLGNTIWHVARLYGGITC